MTSIRPNYCSNCGEILENLNYEEIKKCPKGGIDLLQTAYTAPKTSIVNQLPYKSPGTAALIAFIGGIFGLQGIGHIYIGKIGKGIGILIAGIIIAALFVITIMMGMRLMILMMDSNQMLFILSCVLGISYLVLWIWQIFNAKKLARKFNELVRTMGKELW